MKFETYEMLKFGTKLEEGAVQVEMLDAFFLSGYALTTLILSKYFIISICFELRPFWDIQLSHVRFGLWFFRLFCTEYFCITFILNSLILCSLRYLLSPGEIKALFSFLILPLFLPNGVQFRQSYIIMHPISITATIICYFLS